MICRAAVFGGLVASTAVAALAVHSPAVAQDGGEPTLVLTDQTFAIEPEQPWHAVFDVSGSLDEVTAPPSTPPPTTSTTAVPTTAAGPDPIPFLPPQDTFAAEVRVVAHRPVSTRADLTAVLDGRRRPVLDTLTIPLEGALATTATATTLTVDVATSASAGAVDALALSRPGLYPVTVQIVLDGDVLAEHDTFVERLPSTPDDGASMNVAIVATAPDPGPTPSRDELTVGRLRLAAIAALANAVDGPITVAVPPVLLTGLATADPALDATVRSAFEGDEVLALPADVLDPSAAVAIGEDEAFTRELLEGEETIDRAMEVSSTRESAWLAPAEISTGAVTLLRNLAFESLVMPIDRYDELEGNIGSYLDTTLGVGVDIGDDPSFPAMVVNPHADLLDPATLTQDDLSPTEAAVRLVAELVTARRELGDDLRRSAVLLPPDAVPDAQVAAQLAVFVGALPHFALAPLSELPGATDAMVIGDDGPHVVTLPETAGPDLSERAERIELTRVLAVSAGSMFLDDDQLRTWSRELDTLLSTGLDDAEVDAELARISGEAQAVRQQVVVPPAFTFTLTGRSSPLRLNLRNTSSERLQVVVSPSSPKLTFPDGPTLVELEADGVTEVVIPVEARSRGTSSLEVSILTPAFAQDVVSPVVLTARVNALTGLGQVVTGGAVLVLITWWYGHFRRRRRQRLALAGEAAEPVGTDAVAISPDAAEAAVARPADGPSASVSDP